MKEDVGSWVWPRPRVHSTSSAAPRKSSRSEDWCARAVAIASLTVINKAKEDFVKSAAVASPAQARKGLKRSRSLKRRVMSHPEGALHLLGPAYAQHPFVRRYAVFRLRQADDKELELYLLQLVQALRFESFTSIKDGLHQQLLEDHDRRASKSKHEEQKELEAKALRELHEQTSVSCPDLTSDASSDQSQNADEESEHLLAMSVCGNNNVAVSRIVRHLNSVPADVPEDVAGSTDQMLLSEAAAKGTDLATFLVERCSASFRLSNFLYWYLIVECESAGNDIGRASVQEMYLIVLKRLLMRLEHGTDEMRRASALLDRQYQLVHTLAKTVEDVQKTIFARPKKIQLLKEQLVVPRRDIGYSFADFEVVPLPLEPDISVDGILPGKTEIFKSAMLPCKLVFRQKQPKGTYSVILKVGNDLRQDQFAVQMISLFNSLLLANGIDLRMTNYKVLATSSKCGFVEFVESQSVASVISQYGSISKYFSVMSAQKNNARAFADNFSRSCAGCCVMTYVLGVGDRHLDNLLLTREGKLFHVDFAYLLGQDPKPLPPPMKLTKEMVEAMGGAQSPTFRQFRQLCHTAYLVLRRNSDLILGLVSLMSGSSMPCLKQQKPESPKPLSLRQRAASTSALNHAEACAACPVAPACPLAAAIRQRLRLELTEREAVRHIDHLLHLSSSAVVATFVDRLHNLAQSMRS